MTRYGTDLLYPGTRFTEEEGGAAAPYVLLGAEDGFSTYPEGTVLVDYDDPAAIQAAITEYADFGTIGMSGYFLLNGGTITVPDYTSIVGPGYLGFDGGGEIILSEQSGLDNAEFYEDIQVVLNETRAWADRLYLRGDGDGRSASDQKFLVMTRDNQRLGRLFAWNVDWADGIVSVEQFASFAEIDWVRIQSGGGRGVVVTNTRQRVRIKTLIADSLDNAALVLDDTMDSAIDYLDVFACGDNEEAVQIINGAYNVKINSGRVNSCGWTTPEAAVLIEDSDYITLGEGMDIEANQKVHSVLVRNSDHCRILGSVRETRHSVPGDSSDWDNIHLAGTSSRNLIRAAVGPVVNGTGQTRHAVNIADATCEENYIDCVGQGDETLYVGDPISDSGTDTEFGINPFLGLDTSV